MKFFFSSLINLNNPGHYYHWSIFTISIANLIIIAIMIIIFFLALILPFPGSNEKFIEESDSLEYESTDINNKQSTNKMWTAKIRNFGLKLLPPGKLLPDNQPAYVSSWIYIFGVATLAALFMAIISGMALAIGGADWWHVNPIGHFFNSVHLWSVELFMAFMVIHLWGKFWMAAWRGRRALTWITGVIAFTVSIIEAFTGYLSQQNFDSQWIATNGKDAVNAVGMGTFFNLMNFSQMLLWHVVLIPIVLVSLIGAHILLVRVRGVSHPLPKKRPKNKIAKLANTKKDASDWRGPKKRYDIVKEAFIATLIVFILVMLLAGMLSSPDKPPVTVKSWSQIAPADFMATTATELAGTSESAQYGPPYNNGTRNLQKIGISWQLLSGVHQRINSAKVFVLNPLSKIAPENHQLSIALSRYNSANKTIQQQWDRQYLKAISKVSFQGNKPIVPKVNDGPVPILVSSELTLARSGAIDADLLAQRQFYGSNYTKPLLFLEDGNYFTSVAKKDHLYGTEWGMMNETGSYPGQPWLWLYTLWYQVPTFSSSPNVDLIAIFLTGVGTVMLILLPFIPVLRDIPSYVPVHKIIYRSWNKRNKD